MAYIQQNGPKEQGCVFCNLLHMPDGPVNLIVCRGEWAFVILNRYPYTTGHLMVVPYAHEASLEFLNKETRGEMMELVTRSVEVLHQVYRPQGLNLGANVGEAAGAGIADHFHMHVVPRWVGDTNFMSVVGDTRVLPETLEDTFRRVRAAWGNPATT